MKLTGFLAEIEEIAGTEAALAIAAVRGGRRVFIPKNTKSLRAKNWLVACVGHSTAEKIVSFYAPHGYTGEVPRGPMRRFLPIFFVSISERAQAISSERLAGKSSAELAARFNVSTRTIHRWRAAARALPATSTITTKRVSK